jgi:hypothetical protein
MPSVAQLDDILQSLLPQKVQTSRTNAPLSSTLDLDDAGRENHSAMKGDQKRVNAALKMQQEGLMYRNINWVDSSSNTRCEIKLQV